MALVGYARVSSVSQNLDIQLSKLSECDKIFQEKISGSIDTRQELNQCLDYLREGDTLMVTRLCRLARSTLHLCKIAKLLEDKNVSLNVIDQNINTSDATGRLLFNMLGAIGQFENEIRSERQSEGIQSAKKKGVAFGRKKILDQMDIENLKYLRLNKNMTIKELQIKYRLSKTSVYRYLKED